MPKTGRNADGALEADYRALFRMPTPLKITGRSSSITNAFINAIIPIIQPTADEIRQALEILGMTPSTFQCAYCGDKASEWDHLRPLVKNKRPTGYISEIHNLVPACGKCNQSKGNKDWKAWMLSSAKLSPTTRGIRDIAARIQRLDDYAAWKRPAQLDFAAIAGHQTWARHWQNWEDLQAMMRQSQMLAETIRQNIAAVFHTRQGS